MAVIAFIWACGAHKRNLYLATTFLCKTRYTGSESQLNLVILIFDDVKSINSNPTSQDTNHQSQTRLKFRA